MTRPSKEDINKRLANLSPVKRALIESLLKKENADQPVSRAMGDQDDATGTQPRAFPGTSPPPVVPLARDQPLPLSFVQEGRLLHDKWAREQSMPASSDYRHIHLALNLKGPLNVVALEQSLNEIIRRHEILRASYPAIDGQIRPVIADALTIRLNVRDVREGSEAEISSLLSHEVTRHFDLAAGPLLRATLLLRDEEDHTLLIVLHHLIFDGGSTRILGYELAVLYRVFNEGKPSPLPELPFQYVDFAHWQRQWLQGEKLAGLLSYWRRQLGTNPIAHLGEVRLPNARPLPPRPTYSSAQRTLSISTPLYRELKALCQRQGVTLFMLMMAALKTLLHRYTLKDDIFLLSPTGYRIQKSFELIIGWFAHVLAYRTELADDPTFSELLARVQTVTLDAQAHQDLPLARFIELLRPSSLPHAPRITRAPCVFFNLSFAKQSTWQIGELTLSSVDVPTESGVASPGISLWITEQTDMLSLVLKYEVERYSESDMDRVLGHLHTLLEGIVANPERRISEFPLLTEKERHQLLFDRNETQAEFSQESLLHKLFESQAKRTPDATAVIYGTEQCTYSELNRRADQVASWLRKCDQPIESLVGIYVSHPVEMLAGILGTLKAGCAAMPLSFDISPEQLMTVFRETRASLLLTQVSTLKKLPTLEARIVCLDEEVESRAIEAETDKNVEAVDESLSFVICQHTDETESASIMLSHRAACNRALRRQRNASGINGERVLYLSTRCSGLAIIEVCEILSSGACVVIEESPDNLDAGSLVRLAAERQVTTLELMPPLLEDLMQHGLARCASLKRVIYSCRRLPARLRESFQQQLKAELIDAYRVAEAAGDVLWQFQSEPRGHEDSNARRVAHLPFYLLDSCLQPVPAGVMGEVYIGGEDLSRGFLNRPALTAERFLPDPFNNQPGACLYRTGDVARRSSNGRLEFLGHLADRVKIRGLPFQPGEVEIALESHHGVRQATVQWEEDTSGDKFLIAYLVPEADAKPTDGELRAFLQGELSNEMTPDAFVMLNEMPLNAFGEINREALTPPSFEELKNRAVVDWVEWP